MAENKKKLNRRNFLRMAAMAAAGTAAAACQPKTVVIKETVEVEKEVVVTQVVEVEKEVTKIVAGTPVVEKVVETKVVEKVVTPTPVPPTPKPTLAAGEVAREDTLIVGTTARYGDPTHKNWNLPGNTTGGTLAGFMVTPSFALNQETGETVFYLCEGYEANDDFTEWTFYVRKGVEWGDGEPLTADDYVFTTNMLIENAPALNWSGPIKTWVERVEKLDDFTVKFYLTDTNPRFLWDYWGNRLPGRIVVSPEHVFADQDPLTFKFYDPEKGWPFHCGPWKLTEATETRHVFDLKEDWWGAKTGYKPLPEAKRVIVEFGNDEQLAARLVANQIDINTTWVPAPGLFEAMRDRNPNIQTWMQEMPYAYLGNCTRGLMFNCALPPWDDPEMRSAINYLMDRNKIVLLAYEGANYTTVVPYPGVKGMVKVFEDLAPDILEKAKEYTYNPEKAAELLEGKGYEKNNAGFWAKDGVPLGLVIQCRADLVEIKKVAMAQVEELQRNGIDAVLKPLATGTWGDNRVTGNFEATTFWPCGSTNEPFSVLDQWHCRHVKPIGERAGGHATRWCHEEFSNIVDQMAPLGIDDPKLPDLWRQAMDIYFEEMPFISQVESPIIMASNETYWTNWPTADNPWFQYMIHWTCSNIIWEGLKKVGS